MQPLPGRLCAWISPPFAWTALRLLESPCPGAERSLPRLSPAARRESPSRRRHPSALVLDLDERAAALAARPEGDASMRAGVLERVLQQAHQRRREELRVHVDRQRGITGLDREPDLPVLRVRVGRGGDLVDERRQRHARGGGEADLGQPGVDEVAEADEAATEGVARAPADVRAFPSSGPGTTAARSGAGCGDRAPPARAVRPRGGRSPRPSGARTPRPPSAIAPSRQRLRAPSSSRPTAAPFATASSVIAWRTAA